MLRLASSLLAVTLTLGVVLGLAACSALVPDWNPSGIDWVDFDAALARAQREQKPIVVFLYAEWCPYCKRLSRVFASPEVEREARDVILVRVDVDARPDVSERLAPDGEYVPRAFLLTPDGRPHFEFVLSKGGSAYLMRSDSDEHLLWMLRSARNRFAELLHAS